MSYMPLSNYVLFNLQDQFLQTPHQRETFFLGKMFPLITNVKTDCLCRKREISYKDNICRNTLISASKQKERIKLESTSTVLKNKDEFDGKQTFLTIHNVCSFLQHLGKQFNYTFSKSLVIFLYDVVKYNNDKPNWGYLEIYLINEDKGFKEPLRIAVRQ